jgi:hypothetical protein
MITRNEVSICGRMGTPISGYIIARYARASRQSILSINVAGAPVSGGRGRQVVDEAAERLRGSGALPSHKDKTTGPGALLAEAAELCDAAYAAYRANPDSDDAWMKAGEAGAFLEEALERFAPAYANREQPPAQAADGDAAESAGNPYSRNSLKAHVDKAIRRILGPMLRAAGGEGLGSVAMPLRLSADELAVCSRMGIAPESYLETKKLGLAARRVG